MIVAAGSIPKNQLAEPPAVAAAGLTDQLLRQANSRLRGSSHRAINGLSCECQGGIVRLRGTVPTYYLKQVAQTLMFSIDGVKRVRNDVVVDSEPRRSAWSA
jgi:osmotically-inducible protein OsmY